ncbi:hypothetical protein FOFC_08856 [Fusarium oxysporum]|nr:hypothetical protein FOFC_08856 [Fusarium oxysporum]
MDAILTYFEDQKVLYKSGPEKDLRMVHSIEIGWFILDKYYALVESTPKEYAHLSHESLHAPAAVADIDTCHPSSRKRVENELDRLKRRLGVQPTSQEDEDTFMELIEDKTIDIDALKITPLQ